MSSYRSKLGEFKGRRIVLQESLDKERIQIDQAEKSLEKIEAAQFIVQKVAQQTQEQFKFRVESIVTMALQAVFPEPYEFKVEFEIKRNQTEAKLSFVRNGEDVDPLTATGGGAVDVAAFALRVTLWSLGKTRPVIVLDEPFRFVSRDLQAKAGQMVKELAGKLKLQFIVVTHNKDLIEAADRVFEVSLNEGESKVVRR